MPGPEDLATIRRVYGEWSRGEFWNTNVYDPEIVFVLGPGLPDPGTYHGIEEMGRGFRGWLESWQDLRFELEELIPAGGAVVATYHMTGHGLASGAGVDLHGGHIWQLRDGRAVRLEVHVSRAEAMKAAGLD